MTQPVKRSHEEVKLANMSDTLIEELNTGDRIVIGMLNFSVPSTFLVVK